MASEIRVNKINSRTGVGTITLSPTGVDFTGIATVATLKATTGIVTTFSATGNATVGGTLGVTGDVDIADKIIHTGDTNTAIRFPAADTFTVETAGSERLRITSAGLVGIGTDNPESALHIVGTIPSAPTKLGVHIGAHSGYGIMQFSAATGGFIDFGESGVDSAGRIIYTHSDDTLKLQTANAVRLTIDSDGIKFGSDTAAANALDDYEEGTFEPKFTSAAGDFTSVTHNADTGARYVKVGNLVTVNGCARCTAIDTSNRSNSETLCIGGLPFTNVARNNGDNADNIGSCRVPVWGNTNNTPHAIQARQNQTFCSLLNYEIDAVTNTNLVSQANNSMMVQFSLQYSAT